VKTIITLKRSELGEKTRVLLGGRAIEAGMADRINADAYARDALDGIAKARELMKGAQ
jgi:methanogenic corrinoid protein MtbC1